MKPLILLPTVVLSASALAQPKIEATTFQNQAAFRLSDGKTEAIVVPAFSGRVMSFGAVGGPNWLWSAPPEKLADSAYQNWGGDKTFVGPHNLWSFFAPKGSIWPPQPSWDGAPFLQNFNAKSDALLSLSGPVWEGLGVQITREFGFSPTGEFWVRQIVHKRTPGTLPAAIWSVTQIAPPDAVWLPTHPDSVFQNGFRRFGKLPANAQIEAPGESLLRVVPKFGRGFKIGTDAPVAAIAAQRGEQVFLQRAPLPKGEYPDGGTPVQFYNHGEAGPGQYVEIELLSPLRGFRPGARWQHTMFWSLHSLPQNSTDAPENRAEIARLMSAPLP